MVVVTAKILDPFDDLWRDGGTLHCLNHDRLRLVTDHAVASAVLADVGSLWLLLSRSC